MRGTTGFYIPQLEELQHPSKWKGRATQLGTYRETDGKYEPKR